MPDQYFLKPTQHTYFKQKPLASSELSAEELFEAKAGDCYELAAYIDEKNLFANHIKFTLKPPSALAGRNTWYVYNKHAEIVEQTDRKPESSPTVSFEMKPLNRGEQLFIPGFKSPIYLGDLIPSCDHFYWYEALHSSSASDARVPENSVITANLVKHFQNLDKARRDTGEVFRITSGYRPPHINRAVGGASRSRHLSGDATDQYIGNWSKQKMFEWARSYWRHGGVGTYRHNDIIHLDSRSSTSNLPEAVWYY